MFRRQTFALIFILSLLFGACRQQTTPLPEPLYTPETIEPSAPVQSATDEGFAETGSPPPTAHPQASPTPEPTPIDAESEPDELPLPRYILNASMDYSRHTVNVEETILYPNRSGVELDSVPLMVEAVYFPGVFELESLTLQDGTALENRAWDGNRLDIQLPQPLEQGETLVLQLKYGLNLPSPAPSAETRPVPFGYTQRQANLVDWYPYIPPYVAGKGWLAHSAGFFGEHQVYEVADFEVNIRLLDERLDLIVAASAPEEIDGEWRRYRLESARNFAWSVSHQYVVTTQTVGDVTVYGYAFPYHGLAGEAALRTTAEMLALLSDKFGPYPHKTLSVVEADFLDGMEYDGLYFLSNGFYNLYQGMPGEYLVAIAAHETAHQWWYALVGNDQALEPWLDEALCTYSERIFYENLYPEALGWWWDYRVNYYEPRGWVDGSIYNPDGYRAYRDAVYLNGAVFLEELRTLIGDEAFFAFLRDYTNRYSHKIADGEAFFAVLAEHSQADLTPLLDTYFQSAHKK